MSGAAHNNSLSAVKLLWDEKLLWGENKLNLGVQVDESNNNVKTLNEEFTKEMAFNNKMLQAEYASYMSFDEFKDTVAGVVVVFDERGNGTEIVGYSGPGSESVSDSVERNGIKVSDVSAYKLDVESLKELDFLEYAGCDSRIAAVAASVFCKAGVPVKEAISEGNEAVEMMDLADDESVDEALAGTIWNEHASMAQRLGLEGVELGRAVWTSYQASMSQALPMSDDLTNVDFTMDTHWNVGCDPTEDNKQRQVTTSHDLSR